MKRIAILTLMLVGLTAAPAGAADDFATIDPVTLSNTESTMPSAATEESLVDPGEVSTVDAVKISDTSDKSRSAVAAKAATAAPYCKTSTNTGYQVFAGGPPVFRLTLSEYWCHGTWYIGGTPSAKWTANASGWFSNLFFKFDRYEEPQTYFYNYEGHGSRSGYAIKRRAYFKGCIDPVKLICPNTWWIELHTYLHGDGTVYNNQIYG